MSIMEIAESELTESNLLPEIARRFTLLLNNPSISDQVCTMVPLLSIL